MFVMSGERCPSHISQMEYNVHDIVSVTGLFGSVLLAFIGPLYNLENWVFNLYKDI